MAAPSEYPPARNKTQPASPTPAARSSPTAADPISPAKFAHMLITPTATAAADAVSVDVGNTQNGVIQKNAPNPATHSQPNTTSHGWPGITLPASPPPARTSPATQCHLRSPVRSDDW